MFNSNSSYYQPIEKTVYQQYQQIERTLFKNFKSLELHYNDFLQEFYNQYKLQPFNKGINKVNNDKLITLFLKYKGREIPHPVLGNPNWYSDRGLIGPSKNLNDIYDKDCMYDKHFELIMPLYQPMWYENIVLFYNENKNKLYIHYGETTHPETRRHNIQEQKIELLDISNNYIKNKLEEQDKKTFELRDLYLKNIYDQKLELDISNNYIKNKLEEQDKKLEAILTIHNEMKEKHIELVNKLLDRIVDLTPKN
jgi:hypothetical protein